MPPGGAPGRTSFLADSLVREAPTLWAQLDCGGSRKGTSKHIHCLAAAPFLYVDLLQA